MLKQTRAWRRGREALRHGFASSPGWKVSKPGNQSTTLSCTFDELSQTGESNGAASSPVSQLLHAVVSCAQHALRAAAEESRVAVLGETLQPRYPNTTWPS
ncbi:hypothetical protein WJX73_002430 [Symbiochloris irregularis]|uniref:Uncharacterized protein n=1 Tax=Symbiochloris irregularis TaxID=706552 RepID=A0AAW1NP26_9CHLO